MSRRQIVVTSLGLLLFLIACYFPLFLHLDSASLRLWDESRRGVNAWEMAQNGNYLVPHFMGSPDNWGTKPPLLIWFQAFFLKFLDSPELAIRLPSALSGLFTALLLVWAGKRILLRSLSGYFAALVLLTSSIYIDSHAAIAGDYDALLSLWLTAHILTFFLFVQERRHQWLYLSGIFLLLAGWTKGIAAFFFVPGLFIFLLIDSSTRDLLLDWKLYLVAFLAFAGILSYYLIREQLYPGYLATVWANELGGRYFEAKEGHGWGFGYYFRLIYKYQLFFPWQYFLPLGFWLLIHNKSTRTIGLYCLVLTIVFLLIISGSATKLGWYSLPLIPLLSLVVGSSLERLYQGLLRLTSPQMKPESTDHRVPGTGYQIPLLLFFVFAIFTFPYVKIVQKVYTFKHSGLEREQVIYRDFFRQLSPDQSFTTILPYYNGNFSFYQQVFQEKGYNIKAAYLKKPEVHVQAKADTIVPFSIGSKLVFCEKQAAKFIEKHYQSESISVWETCKLVRLTGFKDFDH